MNPCSFDQLSTGRDRDRIPTMPRTDTRFAAVALTFAATLAIVAPASARSSLLDDDAPVLRRARAAGMKVTDDDLFQIRTGEAVFGPGRELESVPGSSLTGRSPSAIAAILRKAVGDAGGHAAVIDEIGDPFRDRDGHALASALNSLAGEPAPYPGGGTMAGRIQIYLASEGGPLLTDPATLPLRTALGRSGGVWMKTRGWTALDWLTWPAEAQRQSGAAKGGRQRVHVAMVAGDQAAQWRRAKNGSACAVLANGPGAYRVRDAIEAFTAQYRAAFRQPSSTKAGVTGCTDAPLLPRAGASALVASWGRETTGLMIPPGGLVTPPLVAGEPAQVTLQLGADPLGLAAGLGVTPEEAWQALDVVVQVRGPGVAFEVPVGGDGSAPLAFTPTAPGPVSMRIVVQGSGVSTALGAPADLVGPIASTPYGGPLLGRVVADPDGWALTIPLVPTGGSAGQPVLVIVPPFG
jgi:hypothetical protein